MERANKEVNRHIRNILSDKECVANWPQMLCMTEKLLNSSVKQPLGASPNALLFGNAQEPSIMAEMDQMLSDTGKVSVRTNIDTFMARQGQLLDAARRSQESTNEGNLRKSYANYQRLPQLRPRTKRGSANEEHEHPKDAPAPIANLDDTRQKDRQAKSAAQRWIRDPNNLDTYIKLVQARDTEVDGIDEIDLTPYVLTEYEVGDYVLRRYPATKIGQPKQIWILVAWTIPGDGGNQSSHGIRIRKTFVHDTEPRHD